MSSGLIVYRDLAERRLHVVDGDAGALRQMPEVEADAVAIAVLERNPFRAGRLIAQVPQRVDVRADVIAEDDEVARRQPVDAVFGRADSLGELLPVLVHRHGGANDARKRHHVVVHGHAQVDQSPAHSVVSP